VAIHSLTGALKGKTVQNKKTDLASGKSQHTSMSELSTGNNASATVAYQTDKKPVRHVAIIMDGNGRWAHGRGLKRADGHREGVEAARRAVQAAGDLGVTYLTLYSFSTENWRRPAGEIRDLMGLLRKFIAVDLPELAKEGVRVRILGDRNALDAGLRALVEKAERETAKNDRFFLQIAFNYGGRDELVRAAKLIAQKVVSGELKAKEIDEEKITGMLDTGGVPDPDLVVRTSGEKRVSNFLIWQAAYAEYVFVDDHWPDFNKEIFEQALDEYRGRGRRYGGIESVDDADTLEAPVVALTGMEE